MHLLLIDDHALFREGLKFLLRGLDEHLLIDEAGSVDAVLRNLSPRQVEVLRCVIQGQPNKLIARYLALSESTVKQHLSAVLRTLGARNWTEAVYAAAKLGLRLV